MNEYIIDEYVPKRYFQKWRREKGMYETVIPLEFISYVKNSNGNIIRFTVDGVCYEGQKWQCKLENGRRKVCIFRVAVHPLDLESSSFAADTIQIEPDGISGNRFLLRKEIQKQKELIKRLRKQGDGYSKARIRFLESPCDKTLDDLLYWRNQK